MNLFRLFEEFTLNLKQFDGVLNLNLLINNHLTLLYTQQKNSLIVLLWNLQWILSKILINVFYSFIMLCIRARTIIPLIWEVGIIFNKEIGYRFFVDSVIYIHTFFISKEREYLCPYCDIMFTKKRLKKSKFFKNIFFVHVYIQPIFCRWISIYKRFSFFLIHVAFTLKSGRRAGDGTIFGSFYVRIYKDVCGCEGRFVIDFLHLNFVMVYAPPKLELEVTFKLWRFLQTGKRGNNHSKSVQI